MSEKPKSLAERREQLIAKSAIQREQLVALIGNAWQPGAVTTSKNILLQAHQSPLTSAFMAFLAFLFFRRRNLFSLLAIGVVVHKTWKRWQPYLSPAFDWIKKRVSKKR